jgi:hypothetical protein
MPVLVDEDDEADEADPDEEVAVAPEEAKL